MIIESNSRSVSNGLIFFRNYGSYKKQLLPTRPVLNIAISYLIISEGLFLNISQKYYSRRYWVWQSNVSNNHITPNRNLTSKGCLYVNHEQNMKRNLAMI